MMRLNSLIAIQVLLVDHIRAHINLPSSSTWPMKPTLREAQSMADSASLMTLLETEDSAMITAQVWVSHGIDHFRFSYLEHRTRNGYTAELVKVEKLHVSTIANFKMIWERDIIAEAKAG